ncbi:MAG: hypothetical protein A2V70_05905 [Planctomycetes bacterium RBG_13_63_9]|nr:MAG: hypothetical protein A2V70_05905 [Planctomycetes bacterium RBG_13_63_9]
MRLFLSRIPAILKPKRRWLQFSLRTLFVATTLLAIWLGILVHGARRQAQAVKAIRAAGGWVLYEYACETSGNVIEVIEGNQIEPQIPGWLLKLLGEDVVFDVTFVSLDRTTIGNTELLAVRALPKVRYLQLNHSELDEAAFRHLKEMRDLKILDLRYTNATDAALDGLGGLTHLRSLHLTNTHITDSGLNRLAKCTELESLALDRTEITDSALENLKGLKRLRLLTLSSTEVSQRGVMKLQDALPNCEIHR